ncbi:Programmed cell death [Operophtera brumata]|uniref:Programmed cell death n=1 Tax=Operophtera brumata TaxID=104452 RepID=A0A0L7L219_OPEBR|nr:Programmed cell death [Operophtera brumata]
MEVERIASDSENVLVDAEITDVEKAAAEKGAGDAAASTAHLRRKNKRYARTNSKDGVNAAVTPIPKYRSWKNSRRPRNGHGRGLPKKGT